MFFFFIIIAVVVILLNSKHKRSTYGNSPYIPPSVPSSAPNSSLAEEKDDSDYSHAYQRKYLFSRNEKNEFYKLNEWGKTNNFLVFPKVRLLDIIEPKSTSYNYKSLLWKIQAKHIDFVICDQSLNIKYLIELDDNSHNKRKRAERDEFLKQALSGAGYTLIHTLGISQEFLDGLGKTFGSDNIVR